MHLRRCVSMDCLYHRYWDHRTRERERVQRTISSCHVALFIPGLEKRSSFHSLIMPGDSARHSSQEEFFPGIADGYGHPNGGGNRLLLPYRQNPLPYRPWSFFSSNFMVFKDNFPVRKGSKVKRHFSFCLNCSRKKPKAFVPPD